MKFSLRRVAIAFLIAFFLLPVSSIHAASAPFGSKLAAQIQAIGSRSILPSAVVGHASNTPGRQTGESLRLPDSAFAPAQPPFKFDQVEDNALAHLHHEDVNHTKSFDALGRITGWYTDALWTASDGGIVEMNYLASVYPSVAAAAAAVEDSRAYVPKEDITPGSCSSGTHCFIAVGVSSSTPPTAVVTEVFAIGNCTAEILLVGPEATIEANKDKLIGVTEQLATVSHAAVAALTVACSGAAGAGQLPTVTINGIGVYHKVKGKIKPTSVLKLKEAGIFVATYVAVNATGITPSATLDILKGPKTIAHVDMKLSTLSDGTTYFYTAGRLTNKKYTGHLTARVTITIGTATNVRSVPFRLKKR